MLEILKAIPVWIETHPVLFAVVLWPLISGIITSILGKKSAEEYAAMNPRVAAAQRLIAGLGLNVPKVLETIRLLLTGGVPADAPTTKLPKDPPSLPLLMLFVVALAGCGNSQPAQQPDLAAAACISHRTAKELACVDIYSTRPEIDACKAKVKAELDCTKDAGTTDAGDAE